MIFLDTSAVVALMRHEPGADVVVEALKEDEEGLSVVNIAEVLELAERSVWEIGWLSRLRVAPVRRFSLPSEDL